MAKHIVFCADGTWNNPYEDETIEHPANPTNVHKTVSVSLARLAQLVAEFQ